MGRHATGEANYRIAKKPLVAVLAVLVIIGAVAVWNSFRSAPSVTGATCVKGDVTLAVATDPALMGTVQDLVARFGDSAPVVRDYCVRPQIQLVGSADMVAAINSAATQQPDSRLGSVGVWIPADTSFVAQAGQASAVKVNPAEAWLPPQPVGLAVTPQRAEQLRGATWQSLAELPIATPGGQDAPVSALVNAALGADPEQARARAELAAPYTATALMGALAESTEVAAVAATAAMLAESGLELLSPEGAPELSAPLVTFGSGGAIDEVVSRAGEAFAEFAAAELSSTAPEPLLVGPVARLYQELAPLVTDPLLLPAATAPVGLLLVDVSAPVPLEPVQQAAAATLGARPDFSGWVFGDNGRGESGFGEIGAGDFEQVAPDMFAAQAPAATGDQMWAAVVAAVTQARDNYVPERANRVIVVTSGRFSDVAVAEAQVAALRAAMDPARPVAVEFVVLPAGDATNAQLIEMATITGGRVREVAEVNQLSAELAAATAGS